MSDTLSAKFSGKPVHPEWGLLAIGGARGDLSEDVMSLGLCDWLIGERCEMFLDYCCWRQTRGKWDGELNEELLSQANNWRS